MTYDNKSIFISKEYPAVSISRQPTHIHRLEWNKHHGAIPQGFIVHHKDLNKNNYDIKNLELISLADHCRLHRGWIRNSDGIWTHKVCGHCHQTLTLDSFRKGTKKMKQSWCIRCMSEYRKKGGEYYGRTQN